MQVAQLGQNVGEIIAKVGGIPLIWLIDSGASVNAIPREEFERMVKAGANIFNLQYDPAIQLNSFANKEPLKVYAKFNAELQISFVDEKPNTTPSRMEEFYIIEKANRCLLSRDTATFHSVLALGREARRLRDTYSKHYDIRTLKAINAINSDQPLPSRKFKMFDIEPIRIEVKTDAKPVKLMYTNIPFNLRKEASEQISEMLSMDVIEEVTDWSEVTWCSPLIATIKQNGKLRLVSDLRRVNKEVIREPFNMPTLEEITVKLNGAKVFSTIDLANAFYHVPLHKDSRPLTTFWTGEKFFRYKCTPFGLKCSSDIFQKTLQEIVLQSEMGVLNYLDDILIYSKSSEEHKQILERVLAKLSSHNVTLNLDKCKFEQSEVTFLGYKVNKNGIAITNERLEAFNSMRAPESVAEVRSYLGMLTFLERFLVDRATKTTALREIANSGKFHWTPEAQDEFDNLNERELKRIAQLSFYDPKRVTEVIVDASPWGLGAILVQYDEPVSGEPNTVSKLERSKANPHIICCASKALSPVEQRYPQQHREALAVVWAVERFRFYLGGIRFTVRSDNRANEFIFGNDSKNQGRRAMTRADCWALRLQAYEFDIKRVSGSENIADVFSRLIDPKRSDNTFRDDNNATIFAIVDELVPIAKTDIIQASNDDELFKEISAALESGSWPETLSGLKSSEKDLKLYESCLYFKERFYLPKTLRTRALEIAHLGHTGTNSMKRLLREHVWWPGLTADVEQFQSSCRGCALNSKPPPPPPLQPRELPRYPMEVVHIDFLKLSSALELLMVIDAYSRYVWAIEMRITTTEATNQALLKICNGWGKPKMWQSDNGPQFATSLFKEFWAKQGVEVRTTIPLYAQSNGLIERQNRSILRAVKADLAMGIPIRTSVATYLRGYNTRPHSSTQFSPFQLLQGRKYHDYLPILQSWDGTYCLPPARDVVAANDAKAKTSQKQNYDLKNNTKRSKEIKEGDWVLMKNLKRTNKLETEYLKTRYRVLRTMGPKVIIRSGNGIEYTRWAGHLKVDEEVPDLMPHSPESDTEETTEANDGMNRLPEAPAGRSHGEHIRASLRDRQTLTKPIRFANAIFKIYE